MQNLSPGLLVLTQNLIYNMCKLNKRQKNVTKWPVPFVTKVKKEGKENEVKYKFC